MPELFRRQKFSEEIQGVVGVSHPMRNVAFLRAPPKHQPIRGFHFLL
ncbi:MAG: hypothetical protein ACRYHA_34240 [Janthinobacterium lividum]